MNHWQIALYVPIVSLLLLFGELPSSLSNLLLDSYHSLLALSHFVYNSPNHWFLAVFSYRYYRFIGHLLAKTFLYSPTPIPARPRVTAEDVHVIIPTIDPGNAEFDKCIKSILVHRPRWLTVVVGGKELHNEAKQVLAALDPLRYGTEAEVVTVDIQNKRVQISTVLDQIAKNKKVTKDMVIVCVDDHAWWEGENFLEHLLAPFEDPKIGLVGTRKEVARDRGLTLLDSFINLVGCLYLERHNFEITGQNALDGGVLVVSARTCAIRASIICNEDFVTKYTNEKFFFDKYGPLNSDDDNFVTRYILQHGLKIKFQNDADNATCTDIGVNGFWKIHGQLTRWARSQWRSNPASLFTEGLCWQHGLWWTSHAAYGAWFINAPIWMDIFMWRAFSNCTFEWLRREHLLCIMILTKIIKLYGHFSRHPRDVFWLPFYFVFTYLHVIYKLYSLFTFWDCTWSGRKLTSDANPDDAQGSEDGTSSDDDNDNDDGHNRMSSKGGGPPIRDIVDPRVVDEARMQARCAFNFEPETMIPLTPGPILSPTFYQRSSCIGRRTNYVSPFVESISSSQVPLAERPLELDDAETLLFDLSPTRSNSSISPDQTIPPPVQRFPQRRSQNSRSPIEILSTGERDPPSRRADSAEAPLPKRKSTLRQPSESIYPLYDNKPEARHLYDCDYPVFVARKSHNNHESGRISSARDLKKHFPIDHLANIRPNGGQNHPSYPIDPMSPIGVDHVGLNDWNVHWEVPSTQVMHPDGSISERYTSSGRRKKRSNYSINMPLKPGTVPIHLKPDHELLSPKPEDSSNKKPEDQYKRRFVRGCDCRRIHGSGAWLGPPTMDARCGQCRTPRDSETRSRTYRTTFL